MYILFLDDMNVRHTTVDRHLLKDHSILHAWSADDAIQILMSCEHKIDLAFLDHDLQEICIREDGSEYEKHGVYFLSKMFSDVPEDKWPLQFIVHSHNPVGVKNMVSDLTNMKQDCVALQFSAGMLDHIEEVWRIQ